jgi:hypothetical protein
MAVSIDQDKIVSLGDRRELATTTCSCRRYVTVFSCELDGAGLKVGGEIEFEIIERAAPE